MSQAEEAKLGRVCADTVGPEQTLKQISQQTMPYLPPCPSSQGTTSPALVGILNSLAYMWCEQSGDLNPGLK